jgi:hypothetical protein
MRTRIVTLLAGSVLLAGCTAPFTEAPVATNFKASEQQKFQSAYHWQRIADDTVAELIKTLPSATQPLYIPLSEEDSKFQAAFKQQLRSSLIAKGYPMMKHASSAGTLVLDVSTDYVRWADRAKRDPIMGEISAITGGLWVLRNIYRNVSPGAAMAATAISADAYFAYNSKFAKGARPKHELVVSVSASDSNRYYANTTNVYYTTEKDFHNYASQLPVTKFQARGN